MKSFQSMKLLDSLFNIISRDASAFTLHLNPEHPIYKAHFPGEPITPGVVLIQMAVELSEIISERTLQLSAAKNVKFLHIVNPLEMPEVKYDFQKVLMDGENVAIQATVICGDTLCAKLSLVCSPL